MTKVGTTLMTIGASVSFTLGLIVIWMPSIEDQLGNTALMFIGMTVIGFLIWLAGN